MSIFDPSVMVPALTVGLIVTSWQSYKDSPWENFLWRRYWRSFAVAALLAVVLARLGALPPNLGLATVMILGLERAIGDIYKGFFRPQLHPEFEALFQRHHLSLLQHWKWRVLTGIVVLTAILWGVTVVGGTALELILSAVQPQWLAGALIGLVGGTLSATGGSIKDSQFEGFKPRKFLRSPVVGMLGGVALISVSSQGYVLVWSLVGFERVVVELYKTFYQRQVRGIFENLPVAYPEWLSRRSIFLKTYLVGVGLLVGLFLV